VLTPFTASRQHPVEIVVEGVAAALIAGPVQGVLLALLGGVDIWLLFGANALVAASWLTLSHLRHSSVWLSFPKPIALVFSSPAQHQIHHSRDPRHWDRNFGELFSLWDWAAGTLYQPERRETLSFGLAPEAGEARPRPHETLVAALAEPFAHLRRRRG
jgi:sterol desaturase/sphingolipid hydroxylase (fatty acid hydroxylase superfamily)